MRVSEISVTETSESLQGQGEVGIRLQLCHKVLTQLQKQLVRRNIIITQQASDD